MTTPKLKISDLVEKSPSNAYSGDMYPLQNITHMKEAYVNIPINLVEGLVMVPKKMVFKTYKSY